MTERINDYIELTAGQADRVMRKAGLKDGIAGIERFLRGKSTSNYKVGTNEGKEYVIRLFHGVDSCRKEWRLYKRLENLISVPKVLFADDGRRLVGCPYMLMEFVEGDSLVELLEMERDVESAVKETAEILAITHETVYERLGFLDESLQPVVLGSVLEWFEHLLKGVAGGRLGEERCGKVRRLIESAFAVKAFSIMEQELVLSHGDFRADNVLVKEGHVSAVLDWEYALSAPRYFDLANFIRFMDETEPLVKVFVRAYEERAGVSLEKDWFRYMRLIDLLSFLSLLAMPRNNSGMMEAAICQIDKTLLLFLEN